MLNVDYFMMVEPITQMLLPLGSNIGDQNYPLSNCHLDSFGVFFDKLVYPLTAFVKFGFSEKATKFEKKNCRTFDKRVVFCARNSVRRFFKTNVVKLYYTKFTEFLSAECFPAVCFSLSCLSTLCFFARCLFTVELFCLLFYF